MFDPYSLPIPDLGLRCLKCGYALAGLPSHRCPECGRLIDLEEHIPKGDFPIVIFAARQVPITPTVIEILRRARIPYLDGSRPADQMYGLSGATDRGGFLAVPRESYFEVIDLLRRHGEGESSPDPMPEDEAEWQCPDCGETNPGGFEICWNCGESPGNPA